MFDKKDFIENQKAQLKEWNRQVDQLMHAAKKAQVDASVKIENYIDEMRDRLGEIGNRLEDIQKAGDEAVEEVKRNVEKAWKEVRKAFDMAKSRFK